VAVAVLVVAERCANVKPLPPSPKGLLYIKRQRFSPPPGSPTSATGRSRIAWFGWGVKGGSVEKRGAVQIFDFVDAVLLCEQRG